MGFIGRVMAVQQRLKFFGRVMAFAANQLYWLIHVTGLRFAISEPLALPDLYHIEIIQKT